MTDAEIVARVEKLAEDLRYDYEYVGIRVQDVPFELGEMDHVSHLWIDGEDTGEELGGVSIINKKYARLFNRYYGDHIAIVAGNNAEFGEDLGEIILEDAVVVDIIK